MKKNQSYRLLIPALASSTLLLCTTSCASLFGNPNCHCTHAGPCVCCEMDQSNRVVVAHRPVQQDSTIDKSYLEALLNKDYSLKEYLPEEPKRLVWVDEELTVTQAELQDFFKVSGGWTMARNLSTDYTENDIYFYFKERSDGTPEPLRLRVQYYADDPLQFEKLHFIIDGFDYYFTPTNFQRGKGKGIMIWENSDDPLTAADKDLVYAITHCHWCEMKIIGKGGMQHVKMINDKQFEDFRRTLQLYLLKGGTF